MRYNMSMKNTPNKHILVGMSPTEIQTLVTEMGEKPFRATQIKKWLYEKGARSIEEMTDLSKNFRAALAETAVVSPNTTYQVIQANDGTTKFLIELADGQKVECVTIVQDNHLTACLSSQVGCTVGCPFCATGLSGFRRNLSVAEIVDQFLIMQLAVSKGQVAEFSPHDRISRIVFMGMGEPLLNYDNLLASIQIINKQLGIGLRRITISTSGIIPKIQALMKEKRDYNLAISLHSVDHDTRDYLVPINKKYTVKELLAAARDYANITKRRVTFEYTMLEGRNASVEDARQLAKALKGIHCHINLIAYNPVGSKFQAPPRKQIVEFQRVLENEGFPVNIRHNHGQDDMAACGQLRVYADENPSEKVLRTVPASV